MEPETYWEQRCNMNEKVMDNFMRLAGQLFPPYMQEQMSVLYEEWAKATDDLDRAFEQRNKEDS